MHRFRSVHIGQRSDAQLRVQQHRMTAPRRRRTPRTREFADILGPEAPNMSAAGTGRRRAGNLPHMAIVVSGQFRSRNAPSVGNSPLEQAESVAGSLGGEDRRSSATNRAPEPGGGTGRPGTPTGTTRSAGAGPSHEPETLWREVIGEQIRRLRTDNAERLTDVAQRAGVSPQYLSEIERGTKDPSSEMLSAVAEALGTNVAGLARRAYRLTPVISPAVVPKTSRTPRSPSGPVCLAA